MMLTRIDTGEQNDVEVPTTLPVYRTEIEGDLVSFLGYEVSQGEDEWLGAVQQWALREGYEAPQELPKDYKAYRARTTYERRVDFKHAEAQLNASESRTKERLKAQLRQVQDSLIAWTQATTLDSDTVRYLAVATLPEFQRGLQDMFEQAWTHGRDAGVRELPRKVKKRPTVQDVKTFGWDYCPTWSDEVEWSEIVLDYAKWDESKHKRQPAGSAQGGEFAPVEGQTLYHVTRTSKVAQIKKKGLLRFQTSNWVQAGNKERYGAGEIYAFEHLDDAIQWAAKMDWEFNKEIGTGKISILQMKKSGEWQVDEGDPISQAGAMGKWLKSEAAVKPDQIVGSIPVTSQMVKEWTARKHERTPKGYTSGQLAQVIVGNSAEDMGGIDVALAKEGDYWVKQTVPIAALKGMDDAGVDPADARQSGAIVVGARGTIYDGRHRAAAARAAGQTHIEAYVPFAQWDESKHPRRPKGDESGGEFAPGPGDGGKHVTETTSFKKWFGKSKVVDSEGKPLVVYHAGKPGQEFVTIQNDRYKTGVYASSSIETARSFAKWVNGVIYPVYLKMEKPFVVDAKEESYLDIPVPAKMRKDVVGDKVDTDLIAEWALKHGYDGAIIRNVFEGTLNTAIGDDYIVFDPKQLKSKFNKGSFDPEDKRINYANAFEPVEAMKAFENRAWMIKDVIDSRLQDQVRFELFEHLKGGRTMGDTIQRLRDIFEPWVGDPSKIRPGSDILSAPRLENIVRTETTWAYNQGRLAVGDSTDDYVVGYQFTAILDERTTETCQTADGLVLRKDDSTTIQLTPPLHYQCRSMLVYVTVDDAPIEWSDDKQIDAAVALIQPGFK